MQVNVKGHQTKVLQWIFINYQNLLTRNILLYFHSTLNDIVIDMFWGHLTKPRYFMMDEPKEDYLFTFIPKLQTWEPTKWRHIRN